MKVRSLLFAMVLCMPNWIQAQVVVNVSNTMAGSAGVTGSWTVPTGGPYKIKITVKGAKGGAANEIRTPVGGNGAIMVGEFTVNTGQVLQYIAGSAGQDFPSGGNGGGGGGGGSGVRIQGSSILIVAGGGGGGTYGESNFAGGNGDSSPNGGSGNGGSSPAYALSGAGGGGLNSSGQVGLSLNTGGGSGYNGSGGIGASSGGGGYGGGGSGLFGGGGGGGYTGGIGGSPGENPEFRGGNGTVTNRSANMAGAAASGGGISYNTGTNQVNGATLNAGGGQVIIEQLIALPIELLSFNAKKEDNAIQVLWQTAMEEKLTYFDIEKSGDGINFKNIGTLKANNHPSVYQYSDTDNHGNVLYYRLNIHEIDGTHYYSKTISIGGNKQEFNFTNVYPNPASQSCQLEWTATDGQPVQITLTDLLGKVMLRKMVDSPHNSNQLTLTIEGIPAGLYLLNIEYKGTNALKRLVIK